MANEGQFRTAISGFHRQDVLEYIEKITKEHKEQLEELKAQLREAERKAYETEEENYTMKAELSYHRERSGEMSDQIESLQHDLKESRSELIAANAKLANFENQTTLMSSEMQQIKRDADAWNRIKDTAGSIEVSAHERAQVTIQEARKQAESIQAQSLTVMDDIRTRCETMLSETRAYIRSAEAQLEQARSAFRQTESDMDVLLSGLTAQAAEEESLEGNE